MTPQPDQSEISRKRSVFIVDDHPIARHGLIALVKSEPDLEVCGHADTAGAALSALRTTPADLVILDVSLGGTSGIELAKQLRAEHPGLLLLLVSMHDETLYAVRALRAGAQGYVMKSAGTARLLEAIRKVSAGDVYVSPAFSNQLLFQASGESSTKEKSLLDKLSDREMEVLQLLGDGLSTKRIAEGLNLSPKTVETHRLHIKEKLGFNQSSDLVFFAVNWVKNQAG